jgi:hypothetical protein
MSVVLVATETGQIDQLSWKVKALGSTKVWVFEQALEIGFLCRKTGPFSAEPAI